MEDALGLPVVILALMIIFRKRVTTWVFEILSILKIIIAALAIALILAIVGMAMTSNGPGGDSGGSSGNSGQSGKPGRGNSDTKVSEILKQKKGSIKNAPLGRGSPSWEEFSKMTMKEIEAGAKANKPGYRTVQKLLRDKRFDR